MINNISRFFSSINRVLDLPNNNSYYKLDENILSIIPYKDIAKDIFE